MGRVLRLPARTIAWPRREPEEQPSRVRLALAEEPRTRGDCVDGPRPCPWAGCRHHILGSAESCSLDVASRGPHKLGEIGEILGLTHERIRQIEEKALGKLAKRVSRDMLEDWTELDENTPDASLSDVIDHDFKAKVQAAYERIVPEGDRGSKALRVTGWKP